MRELVLDLVVGTLRLLGFEFDSTALNVLVEAYTPDDLLPAVSVSTVSWAALAARGSVASSGLALSEEEIGPMFADPLIFHLRNAYEAAADRAYFSAMWGSKSAVVDEVHARLLKAQLFDALLRLTAEARGVKEAAAPVEKASGTGKRTSSRLRQKIPADLQKASEWASTTLKRRVGNPSDRQRKEALVTACLARPSLHQPPRPARDDLLWLIDELSIHFSVAMQGRGERLSLTEWKKVGPRYRPRFRAADRAEIVDRLMHAFDSEVFRDAWSRLAGPEKRVEAAIREAIRVAGAPLVEKDFFKFD
ncbi:MAG: hypothetical protein WCJ30_06095 [Deltaproteobacteria bacterium]